MKLLLVLGDDETYARITRHVKPLGFELVRYTHVLKAMDNLDEIEPHAIVISARDFPRHWKIMAKFVRSEAPKDVCPFIILRGEEFPTEEAAKASCLGVNGIIDESLENPAEVSRFHEVLGRHIPIKDKRRARRVHTEIWQRFGFAFTLPDSRVLITGTVKNISSGGLSFQPDNPALLGDINLSAELTECSLRAGDSMLSPVCRIRRIGRFVSLAFFSFPEGEQETLNKYLENLPAEEPEAGNKA
ncbi:MAG: PilZ domain-containing protein [Treponema sp.]|nr:PilZ domain-containing protein [Treponema sp.]